MIDLYTWGTPEGFKASIMLEELGLDYCVSPVDITQGEQDLEDFRALSPAGEVPVLVDSESVASRVFEPGAILIYLAEKTGRLLPENPLLRYEALAWTYFEASHLRPATDELQYFGMDAPVSVPLAQERYFNAVLRALEILNGRLGFHPYLAGPDYSIADVANFPRARFALEAVEASDEAAAKALGPLRDWLKRVGARPAVRSGVMVPTARQMREVSEEEAEKPY